MCKQSSYWWEDKRFFLHVHRFQLFFSIDNATVQIYIPIRMVYIHRIFLKYNIIIIL